MICCCCCRGNKGDKVNSKDHNDADARSDDSVDGLMKEEDEELVLDSYLRRQNSCFARMLILSVLALATFLLVAIYSSPAQIINELSEIKSKVGDRLNGGDNSGTVSIDDAENDGKHVGDVNVDEQSTKEKFDVVDWVQNGGKIPDKFNKDKKKEHDKRNYEPFWPKKWRLADVRLADGT